MANNYKTVPIEETVYPINRAVALAQDMTTDIMENVGRTIKTHLPGVDEIVNPSFPGTLVSVLGRPQNAKSFMTMYTMHEVMAEMQRNKAPSNEACIMITTEVSVEVAALQILAKRTGITVAEILRGGLDKTQLIKLKNGGYQVMGLPLFIIGHSVQRSKNAENRRARPSLSPNKINDAMEYILNNYRDPITDSFIEPKLIVTDYLQRLQKDDPRQNTVDFYSGAVDWAKDLALWSGATHYLNVQAKRDVDDRAIKIPMLGDGANTSNVEQSSDTVYAVFMPKVYNIQIMQAFQSWGIPEIQVKNNTIYYVLLKQKDGEANKAWVFEGDMGKLKLKQHPDTCNNFRPVI